MISTFIKYSSLSTFFISAENVIGTHCMLHSLNITDPTSVALTYNFIGKDLIGQLGCLAYLHKSSKQIDLQPRNFTHKVLVTQQAGIVMEYIIPFIPSYLFLPVAGVANVFKNISFAGIGAINAKCISRLSEREKIGVGQLFAKVTAVNTCMSSLGMFFGLVIVGMVPDDEIRLGLLPIFSLLRIYTFRKAIANLI